MYMFFYSLFIQTVTYTKQKIFTTVTSLYTVPESTMSVRQGRDTVWKDVTFCIEGRQTGFINLYSIDYMISGFEGMEASRGWMLFYHARHRQKRNVLRDV